MATFFTKKQKAKMRERRRKKDRAHNEEDPTSGEKRKHSELEKGEPSSLELPTRIVIPAHLSGKDARKFRKEERRKARADGRDENKLVFVQEGDEQQHQEEAPPRKKQKTFPRINDLLQKQKEEALKQKEEEDRRKAEERVPEDVKAKYVALDCEMVGIGSEGKQSALARVSLTDWHGNVVMDTFVQVPSRVTDFRTFVSGVRAKDISTRTAMEVTACRTQVAELLRDKILVGHALKNDLQALLLNHPKEHIRDTAKYRPFQRAAGPNGGKWRPRKLRDLVKEHLNMSIQVKGESHDSTEDARATMELFKRVRTQWEKELEKKALKKKR